MKATSTATIEAKIKFECSEEEARALLAITKYGADHFLAFFKKSLGSGLEEHSKAVKVLFSTLQTNLPKHLANIDEARKHFKQ